MPLTADEQKELDQLEYEKLLSEKHASIAEPAATESAPKKAAFRAPNPRTGLPDLRELDKFEGAVDAVATTGIRGAGPAIGQVAGAATGPLAPVAVPALGGLGGVISEVAADIYEGKSPSFGKLLSAFISGAVPGASLANAGAKKVATEAVKFGASELAAKTAQTTFDEGRLPTAGEAVTSAVSGGVGAPASKLFSMAGRKSAADSLNTMREEAFRAVRPEGVVIPPHELGKGSDTVASFGGKAALGQEFSIRNQFAWQKMAREDVGLSKEAIPIRPSELKDVRDAAAAPYREIQTIHEEAKQQLNDRLAVLAKESDPQISAMKMDEPAMKESLSILTTLAAADVDALKLARDNTNSFRKAFFNGDPSAYQPWQKAKAEAAGLETAIDRAAQSLKDDTLLSRLKASRKIIAKSYDVEDALNPGSGFVEPLEFGRKLANGEKLSGNLEKIAKFQLAFRREAVEASRVPAPGVGNIGAMATTNMASRGDIPGVAGAVFNMTVGRVARPYLLSDFVQDGMLNPREKQNFAAAMARFLAEKGAEEATNSGAPPSPSQQ